MVSPLRRLKGNGGVPFWFCFALPCLAFALLWEPALLAMAA
jgi:hypothetical protein